MCTHFVPSVLSIGVNIFMLVCIFMFVLGFFHQFKYKKGKKLNMKGENIKYVVAFHCSLFLTFCPLYLWILIKQSLRALETYSNISLLRVRQQQTHAHKRQLHNRSGFRQS